MNTRLLVVVAFFVLLEMPNIQAQSPLPSSAPAYRFVRGETLRYLIQRDPYFAAPMSAIETVSAEDYRPPVVERLTEKVLSVKADGTATLKLTLAPEPGFEDAAHPQAPISRIMTVTALGKMLSSAGSASQGSPAERDLLRGFVSISTNWRIRTDDLAVEDRVLPVNVMQSTSPDHDGTLQQTTTTAESDHTVFDCRRGQLVRAVYTKTITLSLTMTHRGRRGSDDFGHVVPNAQVVQTLSVERQAD